MVIKFIGNYATVQQGSSKSNLISCHFFGSHSSAGQGDPSQQLVSKKYGGLIFKGGYIIEITVVATKNGLYGSSNLKRFHLLFIVIQSEIIHT